MPEGSGGRHRQEFLGATLGSPTAVALGWSKSLGLARGRKKESTMGESDNTRRIDGLCLPQLYFQPC